MANLKPSNEANKSNDNPFAAWESPAFWQEQLLSLIPLMIGLLITRSLKVTGWKAILLYIIAASGTREVMGLLDTSSTQVIEEETVKIPPATTSSYQIVHMMAGRIRYKIPKIKQDEDYPMMLESLISQLSWITQFKINPTTGSLTINYNPAIPELEVINQMSLLLNPPEFKEDQENQEDQVELENDEIVVTEEPIVHQPELKENEPESSYMKISNFWVLMLLPPLTTLISLISKTGSLHLT